MFCAVCRRIVAKVSATNYPQPQLTSQTRRTASSKARIFYATLTKYFRPGWAGTQRLFRRNGNNSTRRNNGTKCSVCHAHGRPGTEAHKRVSCLWANQCTFLHLRQHGQSGTYPLDLIQTPRILRNRACNFAPASCSQGRPPLVYRPPPKSKNGGRTVRASGSCTGTATRAMHRQQLAAAWRTASPDH